MIKTPQFLRKLMQSDSYSNKDNPNYSKTNNEVSAHLRTFYPGTLEQDATGRMKEPEYDMTRKQFIEAQKKIDADFEESKTEAEDEMNEGLPPGQVIDIEQFVVISETIPVKVLEENGSIITDHLEIYELDIPEGDPDIERPNKMWIWHGEPGENTCDDCASLDGQIFYDEDEIPECPVHPNCRCWVEEVELDEQGNVVNRTRFAGNPPSNAETPESDQSVAENNETQENNMTADEKFEAAFERLREPEGGYTDGTNQVIDEPTNMGIKQSTLDAYNNRFPEKNFPENVRDLERSQARDIYKNEYWDNTRIPEIENDRIRNAVFDMGVMSGPSTPTKTVQNTLNEYIGTSLPTTGNLGPQTIRAINSIPENQINGFMDALIENRMESLRGMRNWPTAQGGWTRRTMAY